MSEHDCQTKFHNIKISFKMSDDTIQLNTADLAESTSEEIDAELLAEYQKEIARHEEAVRMVKLKEHEANEAKRRAALSQKTVEEMTHRYVEVRQKLDVSRQTLVDAKQKSESRERVCRTIEDLRLRAEELLKKHQQQAESREESRSKLLILANMSENARTVANQQEAQKPGTDLSQTVLSLQEMMAKSANQQQQQQQQHQQQKQQTVPATASSELAEATGGAEEDDSDEGVVDVDMNAMVQRLEAKCQNVREELGRMAVSEQYMRTKQAQLIAKRKEKEALEAELKAAIREKEAQDMRRKVEELSKLLAMRKAKLKATENTLDKKNTVVQQVDKILNRKERLATYLEKQKIEQMPVSH